MTDRLSRNVGH